MTPTTTTSTVAAVARRFPLLGRPRPTCAPLPARVQEIADIAQAAAQDGTDRLAEATHALNKAALIASDCGLPKLARDLCWQHINVYRAAEHPLTVLQVRHMLEPVLNLARLQLRARDGDQALRLLTAMFQAVASNTDLIVDDQTLPTTGLVGTRAEHHELREWVWLHLIGDGIRALTLAERWDDAVAHARAHRGVGRHLMEGRQAMILAHCVNGDLPAAQAALADSTPQQPWELQVTSCLKVMCTDPNNATRRRDVAAMITRFVERRPMAGYAYFRAQLGLTASALAATIDSQAASQLLTQVADEVTDAKDGYAAREVLRQRNVREALTGAQRSALTELTDASGLGTKTLPEPLRQSLLDSTHAAARTLHVSLAQARRAG